MAYNTRQPDVARTEWCLNDPDYRTANAILGKPCNYRTYPKDQQEKVEQEQIKAGYLNKDGTPKVLYTAAPASASQAQPSALRLIPRIKRINLIFLNALSINTHHH